MFEKNIFSQRLRELRLEKNISTVSLSVAIGVSKQAVSQFEKQANYPHCNTLVALAD